jgi:hypothetical protein
MIMIIYKEPPPPRAHARVSSAREPASTDLGSIARDACPSIRAFLSRLFLLRCVSRGSRTLFFFVRGHSPSPAPVRLFWTSATVNPSRDVSSVSQPVAGYKSCVRATPIIGTLDIVGYYQ